MLRSSIFDLVRLILKLEIRPKAENMDIKMGKETLGCWIKKEDIIHIYSIFVFF